MRSNTIRRCLLMICVAAVPLLVASCSSTSDQVSDEISGQVQEQLDLDEEPEVTCPDDAEAGKGESFECTVALEGTEVPLSVTFKDDTNFESTVKGGVYKKAVLEDGLTTQLEASDITIESVDCGAKAVTVILEGDTIECDAVDTDGAQATLTVGLDDNGDAQIQDVTPVE